MIKYILLIFICLTQSLYAEEFALVVGGPSNKDEQEMHEFARASIATAMGMKAQGKKVTTLFGYYGIEEPLSPFDRMRQKSGVEIKPREPELYKEDYDKLREEFPQTKPLTEETILKALRQNLNAMKPGDKFSLVLNAHGHVECPGAQAEDDNGLVQFGKNLIKSDFDSNCHHEISIASQDGYPARLRTDKIFPILKEMEEKGIEVNAIFDSCHSGILKKNAAELENTCSAFLSSGDSVGYGCFESDPVDNPDYTSTLEYIKYQSYAPIISELNADPYFKKSKCFEKVKNHAALLGIDSGDAKISDAYWTARQKDMAPQEPPLSDFVDLNYFRQGNYTTQFSFGEKLICTEMIDNHLNELDSFIPETTKIVFHETRAKLKSVANQYNESMKAQRAILDEVNDYVDKAGDQQKEEDLLKFHERLAKAQQETERLKSQYLKLERSLTPFFKIAATQKGDSCERKL